MTLTYLTRPGIPVTQNLEEGLSLSPIPRFPVPDDFYVVDPTGIYIPVFIDQDLHHSGTLRKRICSYVSVTNATVARNGYLTYTILYAPYHKDRRLTLGLTERTYNIDEDFVDAALDRGVTVQERIIHDLIGRGLHVDDVEHHYLPWIHHYMFTATPDKKLQQAIPGRTQDYTRDEGDVITA